MSSLGHLTFTCSAVSRIRWRWPRCRRQSAVPNRDCCDRRPDPGDSVDAIRLALVLHALCAVSFTTLQISLGAIEGLGC
jgi:hypothetical protein